MMKNVLSLSLASFVSAESDCLAGGNDQCLLQNNVADGNDESALHLVSNNAYEKRSSKVSSERDDGGWQEVKSSKKDRKKEKEEEKVEPSKAAKGDGKGNKGAEREGKSGAKGRKGEGKGSKGKKGDREDDERKGKKGKGDDRGNKNRDRNGNERENDRATASAPTKNGKGKSKGREQREEKADTDRNERNNDRKQADKDVIKTTSRDAEAGRDMLNAALAGSSKSNSKSEDTAKSADKPMKKQSTWADITEEEHANDLDMVTVNVPMPSDKPAPISRRDNDHLPSNPRADALRGGDYEAPHSRNNWSEKRRHRRHN